MKIGIPRGLLYHRYHPLWSTFLEELGLEVVTSPPTSKSILERGVSLALNEVCLPVKVYVGHVEWLLGKVQYLFVPRVLSVDRSTKPRYTCPKTMGLPDLVKASFESLPTLIVPEIDLRKHPLEASYFPIGKIFGKERRVISAAFEAAIQRQTEWEEELFAKGLLGQESPQDDSEGDIVIAVVGHPYILFDYHLNLSIAEKLAGLGVRTVSQFNVPRALVETELRKYKEISWTYEREIVGSISHYAHTGEADGIVYIVSFACGPGSIISEIVLREVKKGSRVPLLILVIDEHTGDQGLLTRLEAFTDIIRVTKKR